MKHQFYYEINAKNNYELGLQRGELFGSLAKTTLQKRKNGENWQKKVELSQAYLDITQKHFPQYLEELRGYAEASGIGFKEFWTMSLEDDLDYLDAEHCTTVVTNEGKLLSHNEDWDENSEDAICVLKKTLNGLTTLELYYYNTLGGVSVCINSHGYIMAINTLTSTDRQVGVPRNIIARWLSETKDIELDYERFKTIPRSLGYNHIFSHVKKGVWDLESSTSDQMLIKPKTPYVHTNHFLVDEMKKFEKSDNSTGTRNRYDEACKLVKDKMTINELITLNSNVSEDETHSIMNPRTIGKAVFDLDNLIVKIWLKREKEKGWLTYNLAFIDTK